LAWHHDAMSGQQVLNAAMLGNGVPAIVAVAFEVVVSVQLPTLVCIVFFEQPTEL